MMRLHGWRPAASATASSLGPPSHPVSLEGRADTSNTSSTWYPASRQIASQPSIDNAYRMMLAEAPDLTGVGGAQPSADRWSGFLQDFLYRMRPVRVTHCKQESATGPQGTVEGWQQQPRIAVSNRSEY